ILMDGGYMIRATLLALTLMALVACGNNGDKKNQIQPLNEANFPNVSGTIYGKWQSTQSGQAAGVTTRFVFMFNTNGQVGYKQICGAFPNTVTASLVVNGDILAVDRIAIETTQVVNQKGTDGAAC